MAASWSVHTHSHVTMSAQKPAQGTNPWPLRCPKAPAPYKPHCPGPPAPGHQHLALRGLRGLAAPLGPSLARSSRAGPFRSLLLEQASR